MEARMVYVTCKDRTQALTIGKAVVEERLAACANVLDGMTSFYWWDGNVEMDNEVVLILKTRAGRVEALTDRIKALHTYHIPCVVSLPILEGNPRYLNWIIRETGDRPF